MPSVPGKVPGRAHKRVVSRRGQLQPLLSSHSHSSMMDLLCCLLVTDKCELRGGVSVFSTPEHNLVGLILKELKIGNGPSSVPIPISYQLIASCLTPWKSHMFFPSHPPTCLAGNVVNLNPDLEGRCSTIRLDQGGQLQNYFSDPPAKFVHIIHCSNSIEGIPQ